MSQSFRLGLFIVAMLSILFAGVFLVGRQETRFERSYRLRAEFNNVAGLDEGADVRVGGIREGTVRKIELPKRPDGNVTVLMDLSKNTSGILKKDSVVSIRSEGLLGDKYVEISFGSEDAQPVRNGDTLESRPPFDVSDLFEKASGVLDHAKTATESLDQIAAKVNQGKGTVGKLVNDKTLYQQATAGATSLHEDAEALQHNFLLRGFFKKQGYGDPSELKKYEITQLPEEPPAKTFVFDPSKLFDKPDSAKLKDEKSLNEVGQYLQTHSFGLAVIVASTGMTGDSEKDSVLSEARSYLVRKYLVDHFRMDDTHLKTIGLGKRPQDSAQGTLEIVFYAAPAKDAGAGGH